MNLTDFQIEVLGFHLIWHVKWQHDLHILSQLHLAFKTVEHNQFFQNDILVSAGQILLFPNFISNNQGKKVNFNNSSSLVISSVKNPQSKKFLPVGLGNVFGDNFSRIAKNKGCRLWHKRNRKFEFTYLLPFQKHYSFLWYHNFICFKSNQCSVQVTF